MPGDDTVNNLDYTEDVANTSTPVSAPPSFRSRATSLVSQQSQAENSHSDAERMLAEAFNNGEGSDWEQGEGDDRQSLIRQTPAALTQDTRSTHLERLSHRTTEIPSSVTLTPPTASALRTASQTTCHPNLTISNDGVFANLDAKPELGEKLEEQPPVRHYCPYNRYTPTNVCKVL